MSHIFISYSRKDIKLAQRIVTALAENDLDTWVDWKSIPKGEDWEQEIYRGIEEAEAFLFLVSPDSVISEMCNKEIAHAVENGKRILPIVIRDADLEQFLFENAKEEISKRNWIFCRKEQDEFEKAIAETRETIHTNYEWLKYHTRLQVKALEWERTKDNSRLLRGRELREAEKLQTESQKEPQPTELHRNYILASQRNEANQRRQIIFGLSLSLILMVIITVFAWIQRNEAQRQATIALARQLAARSQVLLDNQYDLSLLLSTEASKLHDNPDTKQSLLLALKGNNIITGYYFDKFGDKILGMEFSEDDTKLLVLTVHNLSLIDSVTREVITQYPVDFKNASISLNAKWVVIVDNDGGMRLVSVKDSSFEEMKLKTFISKDSTVSISSDGKLLLLNENGNVQVISVENEKTVYSIENASNGFFASKGDKLVYVQEGWVVLADTNTGKQILSIKNEYPSLFLGQNAIGVSDSLLAIPVGSGTFNIYNIATGKLVQHVVIDVNNIINSLSFNFNDDYLVVASFRAPSGYPENTLVIYDISNDTSTTLNKQVVAWGFYGATFAHKSSTFASLGDKNNLVIWNLDSQPLIAQPISSKQNFIPETDADCSYFQPPIEKERSISGSHFSHSCEFYVDAGDQGEIYVWDVKSKVLVMQSNYSEQIDHASSLMYSPDDKLIAVGGYNGKILLLDSKTLKIFRILSGHRLWVLNFAFSLDGRLLASISDDALLLLWDIESGKSIGNLSTEHLLVGTNNKYNLRFSVDGEKLYSNDYIYDLNIFHWRRIACSTAGRNFTQTEWQQYFPGEEYRITCSQWPAGE